MGILIRCAGHNPYTGEPTTPQSLRDSSPYTGEPGAAKDFFQEEYFGHYTYHAGAK